MDRQWEHVEQAEEFCKDDGGYVSRDAVCDSIQEANSLCNRISKYIIL